MTLIKSISGIRGTIGGKPGENLSPFDIVKFTASFIFFHQQRQAKKDITIVIGRDARISGKIIEDIIVATVSSMGANVINTGLSTTPTVEMAVILSKGDGGIIITASHNPRQWNALKLLNEKGEFLSKADGEAVLKLSENLNFDFATVDELGKITNDNSFIKKHIDEILSLSLVNPEIIKKANFKIVVDGVNSTGGIAVPKLLEALGVSQVIPLYCEPTGEFPHNPEPLPENLTIISKVVVQQGADMGIVVDPDVDRLAFIMENGEMFGEEYTLVAVADYILRNKKSGNSVSNLSSTRALKDITEKYGGKYSASAVGEVNVVEKMKETKADIGGEGNGGVIYPELHYGRDSLVGIALFLTYLAELKTTISKLRASYPDYYISKNKITLTSEMNVDDIFTKISNIYQKYPINKIDGIKIDFPNGWVQLRTSNTEPIIRIYAEGTSKENADKLANEIIALIKSG